MKRFLLTLALVLLTCVSASAQQARFTYVNTTMGASTGVLEIGSGIQYHQLTWNISGSVPTCQVQLDQSTDNVTWSSQIIATQACTSNGLSAVSTAITANYVRINLTTKSGAGTVTVTYLGYTSAPGGGGTVTSIAATSPIVVTPNPITGVGTVSCPTCGTGTGTVSSVSSGNLANNFTVAVANPTSTPAFTFALATAGTGIDCSGQAGATWDVKVNACMAAVSAAGGGYADATKINGSQTQAAGVAIPANVTLMIANVSLNQTVATGITLSAARAAIYCSPDHSAIITKGVNGDQITISGSNESVQNCTLSGVKGSFTGNGIVLSLSTDTLIAGNIIQSEANDDIKDGGNTFSGNIIRNNSFLSWGVHAYESTGSSPQTLFDGNHVLGDSTATGAAILNGGSCSIVNNYIKDGNGVTLVDDTTGGQNHPVTSNRLHQTAGWPGLTFGQGTAATGNEINAGGANGPAVTGSLGTIVGNNITVANADGIDLGGQASAESNIIIMNDTGVSGKCGVNVTFDNIGARSFNNQISIGDATGGDTNYGTCVTTTSVHMLNIVIDGDSVITTLGGGAAAFGVWLNNAANLNTNWGVTIANIACVHMPGACIKRTDTQNQRTVFQDIQPGDVSPLDNGTGSNADVFNFKNISFTFATLPTPIGNGSYIAICTDCTPTMPTQAGGTGASLTRIAGRWSGTGGGFTQTGLAAITIGSGTSIGSTLLCATADCPAGTYRVDAYIDITTACGTTGTYIVNLIYTDDTAVSKTVPINIQGTGSVPATGILTTTATTNFGQASQTLHSTGGVAINYSTTATACGTAGPMVGKLYLGVARVGL